MYSSDNWRFLIPLALLAVFSMSLGAVLGYLLY